MILIMLFFTANLWGLFEVGQGFVYRIPVINHKTIIADIWNGFVAVFLATPCSAPFLGTALSFTLTQGPWTVLMIFVCMAFGFGFPYILLTLIPPSWVPLPKPGRWMKTLKETLGWGMYMTALWLIWILDDHMTIFPFLLFIFPVIALFRQKIIFIVNLSLFVCVAVILLMLSSPKASLPFEGEAKVQEHVSGGKIVVVKLSAKWCISCALIDHQIFQDPEILRMTSDSRVEIITGEWTQPSTDISAYLALKNRLGIPLIVIYGPKLPQGIVLSEFPSKEEVIKALHDVGL
jgi:suppressor for copper-sensitivity B